MPGGFGPRFLLEALFLVLVAVVAGLADVPTRGIVLVMAAAWLLTAGVEWAASRERARARLEEHEALPGGEVPPAGPISERPPRAWRRRRGHENPLTEPPEPVVAAPHVRVLPTEPDPAAQPVLERPSPEPAARVEASAAPEQRPPTPESTRKPSPAVRAEPTPVERVADEPPPARETPAPAPVGEAPLPPEPEIEVLEQPEAEPRPVLASAPPGAPEPESVSEPEPEPVAALPLPATPREWNLWDLERLTREGGGADVVQTEERSYLLMYLRDFASPDGVLPADFDGLVRESFGELLVASARP